MRFSPDCDLLALVNSKEIDAESLSFVRTYFRMRRKQGGRVDAFVRSEEDALFVEALERLVDAHPGIDHRYCDLGRRFDWLKWLLQQCSRDQDATLATTAINGETQVTPAARSVQGFPIRWTKPDTCELIHIWLSEMNRSDLRSKYDPSLMRDASLYKWGPPTDTDAAFEWIVEDFTSLKKLYHDVASYSEAILVVAD